MWVLVYLLPLVIAWNVSRVTSVINASNFANMYCDPGTSVLGCACLGHCLTISNISLGCTFTSATPFIAQITCGNISGTSHFERGLSPSDRTISCQNGVVVDCLWEARTASDILHGVRYNSTSRACELQTSPQMNITPVALCLDSPGSTVVATNVEGSSPSGPACGSEAQLLGCQCSESLFNGYVCAAGVIMGENICSSNITNNTVQFCITPPPSPPSCPLILPGYLLPNANCLSPLSAKDTCDFDCRDIASKQGATLGCENGSLLVVSGGCPEGSDVRFEMVFESISCGVDLDNATARSEIVEGLLAIARAALKLADDKPKGPKIS